jgi:hypothetical protein
VIALAGSCSFTFGLFFATAVFPTGPVVIEAKTGALSTIAGPLVAMAAGWLLGVGRFERRASLEMELRSNHAPRAMNAAANTIASGYAIFIISS